MFTAMRKSALFVSLPEASHQMPRWRNRPADHLISGLRSAHWGMSADETRAAMTKLGARQYCAGPRTNTIFVCGIPLNARRILRRTWRLSS